MGGAMKVVILLPLVFLLSAGSLHGQELKKEFLDPVPEESRSTAVKVKGGTLLFLAGHTASQPQLPRDYLEPHPASCPEY
jgi:hypothetical protein